MSSQSNNVGKTVLGVLIAYAILLAFGSFAGMIFQSQGEGSFRLILGIAMAFFSGYLAIVITLRLLPQASRNIVRYSMIAIVVLHFLMKLSAGRSGSAMGDFCSALGIYLAGRSSSVSQVGAP